MFQRMRTESFLTYVQFFVEFYYTPNVYFLWPKLLSQLAHMNCPSSERVKNFFEKFAFAWNDLLSAAKSSKRVHLEAFLTNS